MSAAGRQIIKLGLIDIVNRQSDKTGSVPRQGKVLGGTRRDYEKRVGRQRERERRWNG
jgi:hypothetical protein